MTEFWYNVLQFGGCLTVVVLALYIIRGLGQYKAPDPPPKDPKDMKF